jgi:DNA-binding PadR family transcriptional regulator
MSKVKGSVPRGFTRFYALHLINIGPMTGKEIIVEAERRSEGVWSPSPGLIYPLLGRLLRDGLIEEGKEGKFQITPAGVKALDDHSRFQSQLDKQFKLVQKLGLSMFTAGKLVAEESMDRILGVTQAMKERMSQGSSDLQERFYKNYREFLQSELSKLNEKENKIVSEET